MSYDFIIEPANRTHYNVLGGEYVTETYCFGECNMPTVGAVRIQESDTGDGSSQLAFRQDRDESSESERPSVHVGVGESSECDSASGREPEGGNPPSDLETVCGAEGNDGNSDVDESLRLRSGRESTGELHVDLWSSSISSRLSGIADELAEARQGLQQRQESLCTYIMRSAKSRLKLARSESRSSVLNVIHLEIGIATARNRPDLIENLLERRNEIISLFNEIDRLEQEDYQLRFDSKS
jgi:hypothetical protein